MSSKLANVYAILMREYGDDFTITYSHPPTYLKKIAGDEVEGKIVFFYKEDRSRMNGASHFASPSKLKINKENSKDLDLTGSPLKDDCIVEAIGDMSLDLKIIDQNPWKLEEECHYAIEVDTARSIICKGDFRKESADAKDGTAPGQGSVWFLCNASDSENTVLLQCDITPSCFIRGVVNYLGVLPACNLNPRIMVQKHSAFISPGLPLETTIENIYEIKSNIHVRCSWSSTAPLPALVDVGPCDVTLKQSFRLSDCGPLTQDFLNQLRILTFIRDDILAYKEAERNDIHKDPTYRCGRGIDLEELRESIHKAVDESAGFAEITESTDIECNIETVVQRARFRQLNDLTDKLWEILRCCSSYKDLKTAFQILFQTAVRSNVVNTPTNKNRLAKIITEVANHRLAIPCLSGSEPLELLLEIGMDKLFKDYEYVFTESKICSANILKATGPSNIEKQPEAAQPNVRKSLRNAVQPEENKIRKTFLHSHSQDIAEGYRKSDLFGFQNSNFDERESAARLAKLFQIHCTLEHLLLIQIHLNFDKVYGDVCEQLLQKPANFVADLNESLVNEAEISLPTYSRELLENREPHTRRITMQSKNKFTEIKSVFYFSMENIFPPGIAECFLTDDNEVSKEISYFSWMYRKIKSFNLGEN